MSVIDLKDMYIGANYHPHDWAPERWEHDMRLMKDAGFNVIRLGHLCWDSFEPQESVYHLEWFDRVMDLCHEYGLGVFLDVPTRPAPVWLHKKYPSIDIVNRSGIHQNALTRYMEDVGDPNFQRYALRLAEKMATRYKEHPALLAFGLCNELGAGFLSFSDTAKKRYQVWLEKRYATIEAINTAWSGQRWSRRILSFEQVDFPITADVKGSPERYLDMRRFFSDEIISYIRALKDTINHAAPGVPVSMNHWSENPEVGFDYNENYETLTDFAGQGFYPGINPEDENGMIGACFCLDHRMSEFNVPNWNLEFQTGSFGGYASPRGAMRMYAYLSFAYGSQAVLAWTWRSMLGGEEQYLFGLLDHDGETSFKYNEWKQVAMEVQKVRCNGLLPRKKTADIAIAYSYESILASEYNKDYYTSGHQQQMYETYKTLFHLNLDCNMINLRKIRQQYRILIIPGTCMMDAEMAATVKEQLCQGATVIMTAFSAKVNKHNQVFDTPLPGMLSEVFGIRVRGFDRTVTHVASVNEGSLEKQDCHIKRTTVHILYNGEDTDINVNYHEYLQLTTAYPIAEYSSYPENYSAAVTCNDYGKGKAIYTGIPANEKLIKKLLSTFYPLYGTLPTIPAGIVTRELNEKAILLINTTGHEIDIAVSGTGFLSGKMFEDFVPLAPYEVEIVCDYEFH